MLNIKQEISPRPIIDLAYQGGNNFTEEPIYPPTAEPLLRPEAMKLLQAAAELAAAQGLRLKIFDAFRPRYAQEKLWRKLPDPDYIVPPQKGSPHSRGVAVDLTLTDATGRELDMGAEFDRFDPVAHHGADGLTVEQQRSRFILLGLMTTAGWDFYRKEWWHYQLFNCRDYPFAESPF